MKKKRVIKGLLISIVAIVLCLSIASVSTFVVTNKREAQWKSYLAEINNTPDAEVIAYFSTESDFTYDMSPYAKELKSYYSSDAGGMNAPFEKWIENSQELPAGYEPTFEKAKSQMIEFFNEKYSVSVEKQLSVCKIKFVDIPETYPIGGFYAKDDELIGLDADVEKTVYLNVHNFKNTTFEQFFADVLVSTYFHETIHYLGFYGISDKVDESVIEGFTEALTAEIMEYCGYSYENTYYGNVSFARQMLVVDKSIVKSVITDGNTSALTQKLNNALGEEKAKDLCDAHNLINKNYQASTYAYPGDMEHLAIAQYLTAEYCKSFNPTDEQILEMHENFLVPVAEI